MTTTRQAISELRADGSRLPGDLRKSERAFKSFGKRVAGNLGRRIRGAFTSIGRLGGIAGVGGAFGFGMALRDATKFEERLTRIGIQGGKSGAAMDAFRKRINKLSSETGISREELLAAGEQFVSLTGDLGGASKSMETFARVAVASGASLEDIASSADLITNKFGLTTDQLEEGFSVLLRSGKAGSLELKEMAGILSEASVEFLKFGNVGTEGLGELSSAFQVVNSTMKNPKKSLTAMRGLMSDLVSRSAKLRKHGIDVFETRNGIKRARAVSDILDDIGESELARDPELLAKVFPNREGRTGLELLLRGDRAFDDLKRSAQGATDVANDYTRFQQSAAGRLRKQANRAKQALVEAFTPKRIETFASAVEKAAGFVNDAADALSRVKEFLEGDDDEDIGRAAAGALPAVRKRRKQLGEELGVPAHVASRLEEGERIGNVRLPGAVGEALSGFQNLPTDEGGILRPEPGSVVDRAFGAVGMENRNQPLIPEMNLSAAATRTIGQEMRRAMEEALRQTTVKTRSTDRRPHRPGGTDVAE